MQTILLSAFFAGLVAVLVTVAIEKWGGIIGGVLGTIPTTIIPATIGIYLEAGSDDLATSMSLVSFGMLLNALFIGAWIFYPSKKQNVSVIEMVLVSLTFWLIAAVILTIFIESLIIQTSEIIVSLIGLILLLVLGIWMTYKPRSAPKGKNKVSKNVLIIRGLMAALAIGLAVQLSSIGQPLIAGLASVFPAIFLTTMAALWISQGPEVPSGAAGPMMLGGASVAVYSLIAPWALPEFGIVIGTVICWVCSVMSISLPAYWWLSTRSSDSQ
ncbi:MAG: hypothetical protein ACPHDO_01560 [Candidatus Poseidoniaceae archaeon]